MNDLPDVVSLDEWFAARRELLAKERELTRARDLLNAARRRLPMVRIEPGHDRASRCIASPRRATSPP